MIERLIQLLGGLVGSDAGVDSQAGKRASLMLCVVRGQARLSIVAKLQDDGSEPADDEGLNESKGEC